MESSSSTSKDRFILPPRVQGEVRASLKLTLSRLNLKSRRQQGLVSVRIIWWGEQEPQQVRFKLWSLNQEVKTVSYQVSKV